MASDPGRDAGDRVPADGETHDREPDEGETHDRELEAGRSEPDEGETHDREPGLPEESPDDERESAYSLLQRGNELLRSRHHAQAAIVLERAARAEPHKGSILEALARAYYNSGQHARAADAFAALLAVDPSNHYGHLGLGLSLERLGRLAEARTNLRLAVAMNPQSEAYRRALARVERKAG